MGVNVLNFRKLVFGLSFFVSLLTGCSCGTSSGNQAYILDRDSRLIRFDFENVSADCSNVVSSARVIPLKVDSNHFINTIDKVFVCDSGLVVFDRKQKAVFVFDTLGCHRTTIKRIGRGPEEYFYLTDVMLDYEQGSIGLIKQEENAVLWYGFNGVFTEKKLLPRELFILDRALFFEGRVFHYNQNSQSDRKHFQLNVTNVGLDDRLAYAFRTQIGAVSRSNPHALTYSEGSPNLLFYGGREIYSLGIDSINVKYKFDFGKKNLPESVAKEFFKESNYGNPADALEMNKLIMGYVLVTDFIELDSVIFIGLTHEFQSFYAIVDKSSLELKSIFRHSYKGATFRHVVGYETSRNAVFFEVWADKAVGLQVPGVVVERNVMEGVPWLLELTF